MAEPGSPGAVVNVGDVVQPVAAPVSGPKIAEGRWSEAQAGSGPGDPRQFRPERLIARGTSGATVWITGLSGAGKSTLAAAVEDRILRNGRLAYHLDGDKLRTGLSSDLGFSLGDRDENIRRAAEVARLMADSGLVVLAAFISPRAEGRRRARALHEAAGIPFVEVFVSTSLSTCEERDVKGLYAKARSGELKKMTGVDDPYEAPEAPDLLVTGENDLEESVDQVMSLLDLRGVFPGR